MSSYSPVKTFVGFENYIRVFRDSLFYTSIKNNLLYAVFSVLCQVGFGTLLAIFLEGRYVGQKIRNFFRNVLFIPSVISISAVALLWYFVCNPTIGLINGLLSKAGLGQFITAWLANPKTAIFAVIAMSQWQYTGYIMVLMLVAVQKIPVELYEAAVIDGANGFRKTIHITIPSIRNMLIVTTIITIIGSFKLFAEIYVTTGGGPYNTTQVLGTYMYRAAFLFDEMGFGSAIAVVIFVLTFTVSVLQLRYFTGEE
jgi:raffinose/stachyose/melibiose transport system permease protein